MWFAISLLFFDCYNNCLNRFFVHGEHETDMVDFLASRPESNSGGYCYGYSEKKDNFNWFYFVLTDDDINFIKNSSWFFNNNVDDSLLVSGNRIEVIMLKG